MLFCLHVFAQVVICPFDFSVAEERTLYDFCYCKFVGVCLMAQDVVGFGIYFMVT